MVGRLQGTRGETGGEATTVIIIIDFRAPLLANTMHVHCVVVDIS